MVLKRALVKRHRPCTLTVRFIIYSSLIYSLDLHKTISYIVDDDDGFKVKLDVVVSNIGSK